MSNYRLTIYKTKMSFNPWNIDLHRWRWILDRKDGTIGYSGQGESYTKIGSYLMARYKLRQSRRPTVKKEYNL